MNELEYIDLLNLIGEKVVIIHYQNESSKGKMLVKESFYLKKINKFKRAFKNVNIVSFIESKLTDKLLEDYINEA